MRAFLSPGLQAMLLATLAITAVALIVPDVDGDVGQESVTPPSVSFISPLIKLADEPWRRSVQPHVVMSPRAEASSPQAAEAREMVDVTVANEHPARSQTPAHEFAYLGRLRRNNNEHFFLQVGDQVEIVEIGEMVTPQWRLEGISSGQLQLRYLPLDEVRMMQMGDAR